MRQKMGALILGMSLVMSMPAYGKSMQLVYDGKMHYYDYPSISLYVNNNQIETKAMEPVSIDGRVLVPAREVFEPLGANVQWDPGAKKVIIDYKDITMILTANETDVRLNQEIVQLDVPAKIINDKVMIPIRFVSETLGFDVNWIGSTYSVYINDGNNSGNNSANNGGSSNSSNNAVVEILDDKNTYAVPNYAAGQIVGQTYKGGVNNHKLSISSKNYSTAGVNSVNVVEANNKAVTTIKLDSALSDAQISVANGKVIVDLKNTKSNLNSTITPNSNTYVGRIRTSQFTSDTTRVVFDLKSGAFVNVYTDNKRKDLVIEMQKQNTEEITVSKTSSYDAVFLKDLFNEQISVSESSNQIIFKVKNSYLNETKILQNLNTNYINKVILTPEGNDLVGRIYLNKECTYDLETSTSGITLKMTKLQASAVAYNGDGNIYLNKESGIIKNSLSFTDNYRERQIVVDLGDDYSDYFITNTLTFSDDKVTKIEVTNEGTTKLKITTPTVQAFNVSETNNMVRIELVKPSEKYDKIVVIDPGHGGSDAGALGNGLKEKEINYKHAMGVYLLLEEDPNIKVYTTRASDVYPTLQFRTQLANEIEADLFVSFHNNSAGAAANGSETLYYPSVTNTTSKEMAQIVQNNIIKYCGTSNRGIKPRADLYVLRTSNMPAILIEAGFISNPSEANLINSKSFINQFSKAVYEGIIASFELLN
ncbi:N-acetylmuramoyl-L-alanine amidase family protein [Cellulosilyticum ruminicola]|uniref:N-acetylmuramoyl-L-alanine amidase family protein n=1 Tax=Cellulosilyticum ruminicola TaxID=425254 RepID=UPI0006D0EA1B|nr:N-acetylmuramoyl-L-alanine amidase family protein [Cellulosilyticum ruminicola]